MTFTTEHEVRYSDVDRFGHVNHLRLLEYFECARNPFFRELAAFDHQPNSLDTSGFVVASLEATYFHALPSTATRVQVGTWVDHVGRTSVRLRYVLTHDEIRCVEATTVLVFVDSGIPQEISDRRRQFLSRFQTQSPDGGVVLSGQTLDVQPEAG